jgi:hypothetical protein
LALFAPDNELDQLFLYYLKEIPFDVNIGGKDDIKINIHGAKPQISNKFNKLLKYNNLQIFIEIYKNCQFPLPTPPQAFWEYA